MESPSSAQAGCPPPIREQVWGGSPHSSLGSSEPSPQSSSPSHFQRAGMQRPESLQRNSSTPQVIWAAGGDSGEAEAPCWGVLGGSCSGAADAAEGRWVPGVPGHSLQLAGSSLPSTQSLSRSQTQTRGMQRLVMEHWNWLGAQVTSAAEWGKVRTCLFHQYHSTTARDHHLLPLPSSSCSSTSNFFRERDHLAPVLVLFGMHISMPSMMFL